MNAVFVLSNRESWGPSAAALVLGAGIVVQVVLGMLRPRRARVAAVSVTCVAVALAAFLTVTSGPITPVALFGGLLLRDSFADFFALVILLATGAVALLALHARDTGQGTLRDEEAGEFHALLLGGALGALLMAQANNLLTGYLALELTSIASYLLAGFTPRSARSSEAALKYVVYGGVASGAMLYGFSLFYGLTASLDVATIIRAAASAPAPITAVALVLTVAGLGYKVAAAPFHQWCPDVYQGAPTPVAAFLSVATKAGGFALIVRLAGGSQLNGSLPILLTLAVLTMTLGNLAALAQTNVKRLLAYSSIAQAGYLLLGAAVGGTGGTQALLFYVAAYLFMNLGAFGAVISLSHAGVGETVDDLRGLGDRSPLVALLLTLSLFGLAGMPPTAGFVGKYYLFASALDRGHAGGVAFSAAALVGMLNSVLSVAYYARVMKAMYLQKAAADAPPVRVARVHTGVLLALALPVLALGLWWAPLDEWTAAAAASLRG